MATIVLFSLILLPLTMTIDTHDVDCILKIGSTYFDESKYCTSPLKNTTLKANVCSELIDLFRQICSYNASIGELESQHVSNISCKDQCEGLESNYISNMVNDRKASCKSLCSKDPGAVAVLVAWDQLTVLFAKLGLKKEDMVTTNSAPAQLEQTTLTSKAAVTTKTEEPTVSSTTAAVTTKTKVPDVSSTAAAVTTKTKVPDVSSTAESKRKEQVVATVTNSTSVQLQQSTSASEASRRMSPSPPKGKLTTTVQGKTTPKGEDVETTTTVQGKTTPKGEDVETTTTEDIDNNQIHTNEGPDTESEETDEVHVTGPGTEPDETDQVDGSNKIKEQPISNNGQGLTDEKDDTPSSYHFLIYFLAFIVLCVASYIVFHNKHKIIAFVIEGKQGRRGGRPSTKQYTPLKSKVEDVMPSIEKSTTQSNYIY